MGRKSKSKPGRFFTLMVVLTGIVFLFFIAYLLFKSKQVQHVHYKEFGIPIPSNYLIHGIDVSRYQQRISWKAVKAMQVSNIRIGFAFIKATEGNKLIDPFFKRNWRKAREAGIVRGAYHFFVASKDGRKQAEHFIKQVKLESGDLPPVLDVEATFGKSSAEIRVEVKEWLQVIEQHYSVTPIIYTNAEFYRFHLQGYFDDYPLWVAHYLRPNHPRIRRNWSFWQHSERGRVDGIISKVDFNVFKGDSIAFKSLLVP